MRAPAAILGLCLLIPATAGAGGVTPVIESRVGQRAAAMDRHVPALVLGLEGANPLGGEALARRVEKKVSRPPGPTKEPAGLRQMVEEGRRQFIEGRYQAAITHLQRARSLLLQSADALADSPALREAQHRALLYLAHAYLRAGDKALARRSMEEVVRAFRRQDIPLARYGPELAAFYKQVRDEMQKLPRRKLVIRTEPPGCMVFISGQYHGTSPVTEPELLTGEYLVYIQQPDRRGRVHPVMLAGSDREVLLDLELDSALSTNKRVGLVYPDEETRQARQAADAATVARGLGAERVILVEQLSSDGKPALGAALIDTAEGRTLRSAWVALEPASAVGTGIRQLARFISGALPGDALQVRVAPAKARAQRGRGPWRPLKWASLGVAVVGLAAGAALLALDGQKRCDAPDGVLCPERFDTLAPGAAAVAVGGAAAIAAGIFFYLDSREEAPARGAALAPWIGRGGGGVAAILSW